jgi:hypothetical protein
VWNDRIIYEDIDTTLRRKLVDAGLDRSHSGEISDDHRACAAGFIDQGDHFSGGVVVDDIDNADGGAASAGEGNSNTAANTFAGTFT